MALSKGAFFKYSRLFSIFTTKIRTYGILFNWITRSREDSIFKRSGSDNAVADIQFEHVHLIIYGYFIFIIISFLILGLEILVKRILQRK